jgi:hypothetical protein
MIRQFTESNFSNGKILAAPTAPWPGDVALSLALQAIDEPVAVRTAKIDVAFE